MEGIIFAITGPVLDYPRYFNHRSGSAYNTAALWVLGVRLAMDFQRHVIVFGALLLLGGRLSDILGQRRIFVIGFAVLTGAFVLAGLAPNGTVLIAARALQGIGAAFIAPSVVLDKPVFKK
jgi:MFS family permease